MVSESRLATVFVFGGIFSALDFDQRIGYSQGVFVFGGIFSALDFDPADLADWIQSGYIHSLACLSIIDTMCAQQKGPIKAFVLFEGSVKPPEV